MFYLFHHWKPCAEQDSKDDMSTKEEYYPSSLSQEQLMKKLKQNKQKKNIRKKGSDLKRKQSKNSEELEQHTLPVERQRTEGKGSSIRSVKKLGHMVLTFPGG